MLGIPKRLVLIRPSAGLVSAFLGHEATVAEVAQQKKGRTQIVDSMLAIARARVYAERSGRVLEWSRTAEDLHPAGIVIHTPCSANCQTPSRCCQTIRPETRTLGSGGRPGRATLRRRAYRLAYRNPYRHSPHRKRQALHQFASKTKWHEIMTIRKLVNRGRASPHSRRLGLA